MTGSIEEWGVFPAQEVPRRHTAGVEIEFGAGLCYNNGNCRLPRWRRQGRNESLVERAQQPDAAASGMIPLVPLCFFVWQEPRWALVVYLLASVTDVLDGYLARKLNQITRFGKLMVPWRTRACCWRC